jgi:hypothetical protein
MLTLRPSKIGPPVYTHLADYDVMEDGQSIGRIMEQREPVPSYPTYCRPRAAECRRRADKAIARVC